MINVYDYTNHASLNKIPSRYVYIIKDLGYDDYYLSFKKISFTNYLNQYKIFCEVPIYKHLWRFLYDVHGIFVEIKMNDLCNHGIITRICRKSENGSLHILKGGIFDYIDRAEEACLIDILNIITPYRI